MARSWTMASAICSVQRISVPKSDIRPVERNASLQRHAQRFLELRRGLEQIEYFCKGTVLKRMMKCGKAQCACASDATKRHGPYFELTYKANGKTVNVKLSPQAAPLYRAITTLTHQGWVGYAESLRRCAAVRDQRGPHRNGQDHRIV